MPTFLWCSHFAVYDCNEDKWLIISFLQVPCWLLLIFFFWGTVYIWEISVCATHALLRHQAVHFGLHGIQYTFVVLVWHFLFPWETRLISWFQTEISSLPAHQWRLEGIYQYFHRFVFILFPPFLPLELQLSAAGNKLIAKGERNGGNPFPQNQANAFFPMDT